MDVAIYGKLGEMEKNFLPYMFTKASHIITRMRVLKKSYA